MKKKTLYLKTLKNDNNVALTMRSRTHRSIEEISSYENKVFKTKYCIKIICIKEKQLSNFRKIMKVTEIPTTYFFIKITQNLMVDLNNTVTPSIL